ncbi:hypothetical protein CAEBREN_24297 [Caenorhabditis brenneri]|uniref:Uncharacterized protein n=1 Tax=Caenorhabditis brenneri TaxID=135651 RepID=G0N815_CAEBE|nr:hypothetical protein CAEBREN_24297 [Caenorhabditis brenneri]
MKKCCCCLNLKKRLPDSIPGIVQVFNVILSIVGVIAGIVDVIISIVNGDSDWMTACMVVGAWAVILTIVLLVRKFLNNLHNTHKTLELAQSKNNLLLGLAGIMVFGFLPRIYVICDPNNSMMNYFFMFISLPAISLIYLLFVRNSKKNFRVTYNKSDLLPWIIFAGNYVLLAVSMRLSFPNPYYFSYYSGYNQWGGGGGQRFDSYYSYGNEGAFWVQVLMAPICAVSMIEFGQVLMDKVVSVNGSEEMTTKKESKKRLTVFENPLIGLQVEGNEDKSAVLAGFVHQSSALIDDETEPKV